MHAGVTVRAGDREGLERLFRYGARPPFSLERIALLPDGRVAYRLRKPRRNGATHLVLDPLHFLARISSSIPPPRVPLLRLSGMSRRARRGVNQRVPRGPVSRGAALSPTPKSKSKESSAAATYILAGPEPPRPSQDAPAPSGPRKSLGSGVVEPSGGRIDWASLLRRIYLEDVLACPRGGRRSILADVSERDGIVAILAHLGLPTEAPPLARARSPTFDAA